MNTTDVEQFQKLIESPMRSEARERALRAWETFKLAKQAGYETGKRLDDAPQRLAKQGVWTKGDYIKSLTTPAIDLSGATFTDVCVGYVDLRGARLDHVTFDLNRLAWTALKGAKLEAASLREVQLPQGRLLEADLRRADLTQADLSNADLSGANLAGAVLRQTCLIGADLEGANLVGADVQGCRLDGARVYGVAAWDLKGTPESSRDLVVTPNGSPEITADDIRVAQFIYLLVNNPEIRNVLDTVTRKVVLLLGRFTPERKAVLDALRDRLRQHNLVPVLFDFEQATDRDITETITLLARMARFVIADLTEPASIPQELQAIAPDVAVPIRLVVQAGHKPYSMSKDLKKYPWVIKPYRYADLDDLLANVQTQVLDVAETKRLEIQESREDDDW
ncbi:MAG: pentapeptide repeat-containing protein [Gammaproteobacteria bacterium]|nr:pentapeptide repeat-containing protein [Gammaproteobacteria bacterium]